MQGRIKALVGPRHFFILAEKKIRVLLLYFGLVGPISLLFGLVGARHLPSLP